MQRQKELKVLEKQLQATQAVEGQEKRAKLVTIECLLNFNQLNVWILNALSLLFIEYAKSTHFEYETNLFSLIPSSCDSCI